jgi:hypothetical protein
VLFLYSTMTRTISEIMAEAGSAEDWGGGTALPDSVLRRVSATFENLSQVANSEHEVGGRPGADGQPQAAPLLPSWWARLWFDGSRGLAWRHRPGNGPGRVCRGAPLGSPFHSGPRHAGIRATCPPGCSLRPQLSVADFLADGDHVTRMLKEWGDALESRLPPPHRQAAAAAAAAAAAVEGGGAGAPPPPAQAAMSGADVRACVCVLRCVLLLARLAGRFVARFLPQFMVLLAAGLRPANPREVKLQCLEGWLGLVRALAAEAPVQLGGVVNQASGHWRGVCVGSRGDRGQRLVLTRTCGVCPLLP